MRIAILVAVLAVTVMHQAHASCGGTHTAVSPPTGARLPAYATIYLFDPEHEANIRDALAIDRDDGARSISYFPTKLVDNGDHAVHRIELGASSGPVTVRWRGAVIAHYTVAGDGAELDDRAVVVDVTHHTHDWTCSFENVIKVAVEGNAIAYRIDWDDDRTTVVADEHVMWSDEPADPETFELGHPDCQGFNVDPDLLATQRSFKLYALFADGKVTYVGTSIAQLDDHGVRLPTELIRGADVRFPRHFSVAVATSPLWVFAAGGTGGVAGAFIAAIMGRRRRRLRVYSSPLQPR